MELLVVPKSIPSASVDIEAGLILFYATGNANQWVLELPQYRWNFPDSRTLWHPSITRLLGIPRSDY